jgi:hypothetical protein
MMTSPIVLFVYNRPSHTQRTINALKMARGAKDSDLFIFSDAARDANAQASVDAVRDIITTVSGFKSVNIIRRDRNWGLAASVVAGVTELCRDFSKVIVLEDDLVVGAGFLEYMNQALDIYQDNDEVMQVSGHMFPVETSSEADAFFLPFTTSWGWATWQRAWNTFDADAKGYALLKTDASLRKAFDLDGAYPYFKMLEAQFEGRVDSWAIRWYLTVFLRRGVTLYPRQSLVSNTGFDGSGTHGAAYNSAAIQPYDGSIRKFPPYIRVDEIEKRRMYRYLSRASGNTLSSQVRLKLRSFYNACIKNI